MDSKVTDAVSHFISANTWQERSEVFHKLSDTLRSSEALSLLEYNAADERHAPYIRRALDARIRLLKKSYKEIEEVYTNYETFSHAVMEFINAESASHRQQVADLYWNALSNIGADQLFADLLLQEREDDEIKFIETCWDVLEKIRNKQNNASTASTKDKHITDKPQEQFDDPIEAYLHANRWSETQQLLERATHSLFSRETLDTIEARVNATEDSEKRKWLDERLQLLHAAHRFGIMGAYAYEQGYGKGGTVIPNELIQELQIAAADEVQLQDIWDRHPILISVYQKMVNQNPGVLPPPHLPSGINTAFNIFMEILSEKSPARVINKLTPLLNKIDPRLYPGLCGAIHLQLGDAYNKLEFTDAAQSNSGIRSIKAIFPDNQIQ